jgi:hypothetical protein
MGVMHVSSDNVDCGIVPDARLTGITSAGIFYLQARYLVPNYLSVP